MSPAQAAPRVRQYLLKYEYTTGLDEDHLTSDMHAAKMGVTISLAHGFVWNSLS